MALEFAARLGMIVDAPEVIAVGHGRHGAVERKNFQAVAREVEVADDFRAEKRDDVGKNGELESGNDFFSDGGAAENVAALENQNFLARAGEIGRVYKAVVAAADDNDVVAFRHEDFLRLLCRLRRLRLSRISPSILQACGESHKNEARDALTASDENAAGRRAIARPKWWVSFR